MFMKLKTLVKGVVPYHITKSANLRIRSDPDCEFYCDFF